MEENYYNGRMKKIEYYARNSVLALSEKQEVFFIVMPETVKRERVFVLGQNFINIINNREKLFEELDNWIREMREFKTLEELKEYIGGFRRRINQGLEKSFYKTLFTYAFDIFFEKVKEYTKLDDEMRIKAIERDIEINQEYIDDIKKVEFKYDNDVLIRDLNIEEDFYKSNKYSGDLYCLSEDVTLPEFREISEELLKINQEKLISYQKDSNKFKINQCVKVVEEYFNDIKNIILDFLKSIEKKQEDLKTYLLWNVEIPKTRNIFATVNNGKYSFYTANSFNTLMKNKSIKRVKKFKEYIIEDFREILDIYIDLYYQEKFSINKCENCGKYFMPINKISEKYCNNIFKNNLTCREYAPKMKYRQSIDTDEIKNLNYKLRQRYTMKISREEKWDKKKILNEEFDKYKKEYDERKKKSDKGDLEDRDFIKWIEEKLKEYDKKYSRSKNKK